MILFLLLAILGFCASVVVHGSTFLHQLPVGMNRAWPLHIGIFLVFIPAVVAQRLQRTGDGRKRTVRVDYPDAPRWMLPPLVVLFVYAILNFGVGVVQVSARLPGRIVQKDGQYVVVNRGVVLRPATEAEYQQAQARTLRLFSGHWMMFYWASAVGIVDGLRRRRREAAPGTSGGSSPQLLRAGSESYMLRPSPWLGPWAHATLLVFVRIVGMFGCFLAVAICTISLANRPGAGVLKSLGCVGFLLTLPAALFGAIVPADWVARRLAARCPFCNGRAYCDAARTTGRGMYNLIYTCRDCGASFRSDGSRAAK